MNQQNLVAISKSFFVDPEYKDGLRELGLSSIDEVFSCTEGTSLEKENLKRFRKRIQIKINSPSAAAYIKLYDRPPVLTQVKNWLSYRKRVTCCFCDFAPAYNLSKAGINTPKTLAYGEEGGLLFEKRSFIIMLKIPNAESLEKKLPDFFHSPLSKENLGLRRDFINELADFIKRFHNAGYRHRDLYFSHIFLSDSKEFYLIDLARSFKPLVLTKRFQIKDISQLYYSAPGRFFSRTDRLRFYVAYSGCGKLKEEDKIFIHRVIKKVKSMEKHNRKYGREVPFKDM